jgi:hypothetical protein
MTDYYEFLQISPHADADTIHRVYRFLAARFHPDNPESGDADLFHLVRTAYDVLSDPERRAEYDQKRKLEPEDVVPLSTSIDFMDDLEGELNRRVGLLALLYHRRRTKPDLPEVPLVEIETLMGFPREYLDFTIWYLGKKGYITRSDNAQFALTADGVDFVETQRGKIPILNKLLTTGAKSAEEGARTPKISRVPDAVRTAVAWGPRPADGKMDRTPIVVPSASIENSPATTTALIERRVNKVDRRDNPPGSRPLR